MPENRVRTLIQDRRRPARTRVSCIPTLLLLILLAACRAAGSHPVPAGPQPQISETGAGLAVISPYPSSTMTAESAPTRDATAFIAEESAEASSQASPPAFGSCSDSLIFMGDLSFPDRSPVLRGQALEKKWKVRNGGLCDWGPEYRFRWVGGAVLSERKEFALYPAAAGSEAVVSIALTAPLAAGEYISSFRAFSPLGIAFGDTLYIDVVVAK
ncbi:MAG: NBR1-Ig-like domain-containing protein [Anaerolineales bacterium]